MGLPFAILPESGRRGNGWRKDIKHKLSGSGSNHGPGPLC